MMDGFMNFVSDIGDHVKHGEFEKLLGVATDDPNSFMKTKGQEVGKEIMSKLMHSVYEDDGLEPPGDGVATRSLTPKDLVSNAGLGEGTLGRMLAPLVAGIVASIQESGVKDEIVQFAQKRAFKTIEEHSAIISSHGEKLGGMVIDGLTTAVKARGDPAAAPEEKQRALPVVDATAFEAHETPPPPVMEPVNPDAAAADRTAPPATKAARDAGMGGAMAAAFMKPLSEGVNAVLGKGDTVDRVVDVVGDWVPLDKLKNTLKTTLQPQYERACVAVSPQLEAFGGFAGGQVLDFMKKGSLMAIDQAKDQYARSIVDGDGAVERELMAPVLAPFMRGMLGKIADGGFGGAALGTLAKMLGCFSGGKQPAKA